MKRQSYLIPAVLVTLVAALILLVIPAAAQNDTPGSEYPANTISVTGSGSAYGSPDRATIEIGVERTGSDIAEVYAAANEAIEDVIEALVAVGIERSDIRTSGFNIYQDRRGVMPMLETDQAEAVQYTVNNQLRVVVREIGTVADVINTAVESGANNVYGLTFGISDSTELERDARVEALANARERAEQLAELIGAELGDVLIINEGARGIGPFPEMAMMDGRGGAVIEPGELSVSVQVEVTYRINR
jgi:uncharacterized protein